MRPNIRIDINQAIANTRFIEDLSTVLYGAELVLKRMGATDSQIAEISDEIIRTSFSSLEFNFESISALLSNNTMPAKPEANQPAGAAPSARYPAVPVSYGISDSDIDLDFFDDNLNPGRDAYQSQMYRMSEKTYDSHMDEDEDLEHPDYLPFQKKP